jgi:hypothetical protein
MTALIGNMSDYVTESFVSKDEADIVNLFNSEHAKLVGFVPRTVEYWRWCCLNRPDVDKKSVVVVKKNGTIAGYAVVGKSGNIWELCYDSKRDGKAIVSALLTWALDYAKSVQIESLVLNAYVNDKVVREVCSELDFALSPSEPLFLSVLDLPELICAILRDKKLSSGKTETFWFNFQNCPPWCPDSFGIKLRDNQVSILTEDDGSSKTTIETEISTFVALIFGNGNALKAVLSTKVHFDKYWRIFRVLKFFNSLKAKSPWFIPRADLA